MKIVGDFWLAFEGCPFGTHALVNRAFALYGALNEKKEMKKQAFLSSRHFVVTEAAAKILLEKIYGSFEIFSCQEIDGKFFPRAVMLIDIEAGIVTIKISSQWPYEEIGEEGEK
jgi:hypothetical protein